MDIGASNRAGTRFGPRQIRAESCMVRPYNMATRAAPFDSLQVADIGDVAIDTFNLPKCMDIITAAYDAILAEDCIPLTLGGDHTLTFPILRAMAKKHGPVGLIHVDAHADINDTMFGEPIAHGTPFRRAVEAGAARHASAASRSGCAAPAMRPTISTGRAGRAFASCRPRSAGTNR